ncbi:DUF5723 family protein [Capnocytophaga endodontalis]|jgi:putative outer membrane protein, ompA family|uniref:DUF5723 domain-containing protein n=1 Tax=Capnocytophaga endodontalis TaxID=2708117 RepID=A0A1Z4BRQ9_9FLAO|nr:DUF5723 family protein [Capnocytophaga endodontalis]ASF43994.1 hypothetical protein CBG49_13350 [Capnocytophaga endodontalis]
MKKVILSALFLTTIAMEAQQSFAGLRESYYSGVIQTTANPAYMISSKRPWDASLFLVNFGLANNAIKMDTDITKSFNDFTRNDANNPLLRERIDAKVNVDVMGPSLYVKINDQHTVGVFSRVRALGNVRNFDAKLLQSIFTDAEKLDLDQSYQLNLNNQEIAAHIFSEIGFSWAGELYFDGHNAIKAGASLKIIQGSGNVYAGFRNFEGATASLTVDRSTKSTILNIQSHNGVVEILNGGTSLVDTDNINASDLYFKSKASTVGFDLGATYEYKKDGCPRCHNNSHDLRVGVSIMDIGRLQYTPTKDSQRYRMPASGVASLTMDDLSEEKLKSTFGDNAAVTEKIKVSLPTSLNLSVDYRIAQPFFVNLATRFNLTNKSNAYTAAYANEVSLTPRVETEYLGAYLPLSYNQISKTNIGLALRLGPFVIGSNTILSNLTKSAKDLNFFFGVRFGHRAYQSI